MMKIVFMGTPDYATQILKGLLAAKFEICAVFTQPDKPVGRKQILTPPSVKQFLLDENLQIPIFQPNSLKEAGIKEQICAFKPDFIVVAAYGQILPSDILGIAPCINLHASILPKYRGASPIQSAILCGEKFSGVTAMKMGAGLDDGDMLGFSFLDIRDLKSSEIFDQMAKIASNLIVKILKNYENLAPISQIHALSTKCSKIKKEFGLIKFSDDIDEILRKFRAFDFWPNIFLDDGTKLLEVAKFSDKIHSKSEFGKIVVINKNSFVIAVCGGELEITKIQEVGKKPLNANDFINGKRLKIDDRIC
ncbi:MULTISPECIES: methionyl-tRNA formyltransferase [unclassified Campylobacter]|uniref:methionyl-tRNA formyltransferase n=1 Tax=unclassified Campylobacter TaxID=2593542 RepID=UPI0022E9FA4A|nr:MULTISPECIES: methionyl-tRNA formyltransferase [unclassified Campylobacter]MDA3085289.1 methionyl-tRNA formyltransferase [Campylobacter sp. CS_ED1]MDA3079191.1 methionyl-tRNA formyltransferase [Campylobacter sp. CS_NA2]MDA3080506.1 methionyl-tRNA formyltransferase [Campylobacter sp. CS_NA1]MDA3090066.1 methionyl-tRNA formyltransferase [Campylobacter sp. CS_ED2]WBR52030.1 methionyl-tRNA formyltransferase [Campylobacter sp. CS_NA3]